VTADRPDPGIRRDISGFPDKDISRDKDISGPGSFLQIPGIIEMGD
jgi:hypothetical protein